MPFHHHRCALWALALATMALQGNALAAGKPANRDDVKAYALQCCLDHTYVRSGK